MEKTIEKEDSVMKKNMIFHMAGMFKGVYLDKKMLVFLAKMEKP